MKQNKKQVKVSEAEYQVLRRDKKRKIEIKSLVMMLFDKTKNWK